MLKSNKVNLLISIVCAIALWAYITTVVNPETERTISSIPVELVNIDALNDRGFTVDEGTAYLVDIAVRGARSEVAKLTASDFRATADMTGYRKGANAVPVNITLPNEIELTQVRPESIPVTVVDLITVFKPVRLEFEESFPRGQEPGFIEIIPDEMEVSGVTDLVDSVDYIRALVKTGELTEEISTFRVDVYAIDKDGQPVYNISLSQPSVEITGALCTTKVVPLRIETIGEPREDIEITDMYIPSYIIVRGVKEVIEGLEEVECRPVDLTDIIFTEEIPVEPISLPSGVEVADGSRTLAVRVEVQGIATREFEFTADMIEIINLEENLSGHVNTGRVVVTVLAPPDVITGVIREDLRLYVDATDFHRAVSAVEMEVVAECSQEVKKIIIEPQKVRVTIIRD
ncbi:MAG: CdaR family protein [Clostridiales bacterium]|nr:CdaR family protein [Clostridiales bacterium]